jgi:hypothetical protein
LITNKNAPRIFMEARLIGPIKAAFAEQGASQSSRFGKTVT